MKLKRSKKAEGMEISSTLGSWVWFLIFLAVLVVILMLIFGPKMKELAERFVSLITGKS